MYKTAFLCSQKCPAEVVLKSYDWTKEISSINKKHNLSTLHDQLENHDYRSCYLHLRCEMSELADFCQIGENLDFSLRKQPITINQEMIDKLKKIQSPIDSLMKQGKEK